MENRECNAMQLNEQAKSSGVLQPKEEKSPEAAKKAKLNGNKNAC